MTRLLALAALVFGPMLLEARRSRHNERALRAAGAVEPRDDVYVWMQVAYPACFLAMIAEGWLRPQGPVGMAAGGAAVFAAGKWIKYWAIGTLGPRWTFRVLVPPGSARTAAGPYRWMRHPNYVGVAGELAGFALLARAPVSGVLSLALFGALLLARIRVEERALDVCDR
jgi:methyltransferase